MRRSGAGGVGGAPPPDGAAAPPPESPAPDEGVTACPLASPPSIWLVCCRGEPLLRFDGAGAEARAGAYAEQVRGEIRAGTFGLRRPKGACSLGHPCDRDRVHGFLRDLPDHVLAKLALCAEHQEQARPGSQTPQPPPSPSPGAGRRRKAVQL